MTWVSSLWDRNVARNFGSITRIVRCFADDMWLRTHFRVRNAAAVHDELGREWISVVGQYSRCF